MADQQMQVKHRPLSFVEKQATTMEKNLFMDQAAQ
jgi:hypothetical protein